jgi:alkylhydroperoxidase family enzyme
MLSWLIRRRIDAFEKEFSYDMDYARDLLGTSFKAMMLFHRATGMGDYREDLPKDAWYAAKLATLRVEDCGPCTQLVATMAERDGQSTDMIRAVLSDRLEDLSDDVRLAVEFTRATLRHDPTSDALRERVVERFGRGGLVSLALAMLSSRLYPTLKYALGYGHTCTVVHVAGTPVLTPWPSQ